MVGRSWMDVGMIFYQFLQELMVYMFLCCRCGMNKYLIKFEKRCTHIFVCFHQKSQYSNNERTI